MQRYDEMFKRLGECKQGAFVPFVTVGDPSLDLSFEIIKTLIDQGADALELGIPFSDPIADGPTIQNANIRALAAGVTPAQCFELISKIRTYNADIPIGLLLYSNLVMARGIDHFYQQAQTVYHQPQHTFSYCQTYQQRSDLFPCTRSKYLQSNCQSLVV